MVFLCEKYSQAIKAAAPYARASQNFTSSSPGFLNIKMGDLICIFFYLHVAILFLMLYFIFHIFYTFFHVFL